MKRLLIAALVVMAAMVGVTVSNEVAFGGSSERGDREIQASAAAPNALKGITFEVGPDEALIYPSSLVDLPDEHTTFIPRWYGLGGYLVFGASRIEGVNTRAGTVVLETKDLHTFTFAHGYTSPVMFPPLLFTECRGYYDPEFDLNYAAPGTVVQDPTRPPGNLIMIYEAENHCPGGVWQQPFYATVGLARSSDHGKTWPQPVDSEFGGPDRYPILKISEPEPTNSENPPVALGDATPSAFVDGKYLYVTYHFVGPGSDGLIRVARAKLGGSDPISFKKWYDGAFSEPGIGGLDSGVLPSRGCEGYQVHSQISYNHKLDAYLMTFVCVSLGSDQAAWYYSTATSLAHQDWTDPQMIENSQFPVAACGEGGSGVSFDGWYPSFMSPGFPAGHTSFYGRVFFLSGCETGSRTFMSRRFWITGPPLSLP
jgi:hypothetical protein